MGERPLGLGQRPRALRFTALIAIAVGALGQRAERQAHLVEADHPQVRLVDQPHQAAPGEEAHMGAVEDAAHVVVERAECRAGPRVPVPKVGHRDQHGPPGGEQFACVGEHPAGLANVLEHVAHHHDVEALVAQLGDQIVAHAVVQVGLHKAVGTIGDPGGSGDVDAGHVVAARPGHLGELAPRAAQVEHAGGRHRVQPAQQHAVRAVG